MEVVRKSGADMELPEDVYKRQEEGKLVPVPGVDDHITDRKAPGLVVIGMIYIEQIK